MERLTRLIQKEIVKIVENLLTDVYRNYSDTSLSAKFSTEDQFVQTVIMDAGFGGVTTSGKNMYIVTSGNGKTRKPRATSRCSPEERCEARTKNLYQCNKKKKIGEQFCNVHHTHRPYKTVNDEVENDPLKTQQSNIIGASADPAPEPINMSKKSKKRGRPRKKTPEPAPLPDPDDEDPDTDEMMKGLDLDSGTDDNDPLDGIDDDDNADDNNDAEDVDVDEDPDGHLVAGGILYEQVEGDDGDMEGVQIGKKVDGVITLDDEYRDEYSSKYEQWITTSS